MGNTNTLYAASQNNITGNSNRLTNASNNEVYGNSNVLNNGYNASSKADNNHIWGDNNELQHTIDTWILGSNNKLGITSKDSQNNFIIGNSNTFGRDGNTYAVTNSLVFGNNNKTGNGLINSTLIGSNMQLGKLTAGTGGSDIKNSVVIGQDIVAPLGSEFMLIGSNINAESANKAVVVGANTATVKERSTILGYETSADEGAVAIGLKASAIGDNSVAIGPQARTTEWNSVAIGYNSGTGEGSSYAIALGRSTAVAKDSQSAIAIGSYAYVGEGATSSIAIGANGRWGGSEGNPGATFSEDHSAVGDGSYQSIALGSAAVVDTNAQNSIAIGGLDTLSGQYDPADGIETVNVGSGSVNATVVGVDSFVGKDSTFGTVYGSKAKIGDNVNYATAIGSEAFVSGSNSLAAGYQAKAEAKSAVATGDNAQALADNSVAIGKESLVTNKKADGTDRIEAGMTITTENSIAIGAGSKVTADSIFTENNLQNYIAQGHNEAWNIQEADSNGVISVGSADGERRIINVARGRIDENSTDAVNGSQLYGLASDLNQKIEKAGGDWALTTNGGLSDTEKTTVGKGDVVDFSGAKDENGHQNIQISQEQTKDDDGNVTGTKVAVDLNDRVELGAGDQQIVMDATDGKGILTIGNNVSMSANGAANFGNIQFNSEGQADPQHVSTITGLSNTEWDAANAGKTVAEGGYSDSTRAATEAQLYDAIGSATSSMGWNVTTNGATDNKKAATIKNGAFVDFSGKVDENSANIIVDQNPITDKDGNVVGTNLSFDLNDKIARGTPDVQNNTGIFLDGTTGSATFGGIKVNGESGERTITGLTNTEWDPNTTYNSGRAATEEQLQKAVNQVNADAYNGWKVSANGENDVLVERGDVVDFSSATKTVTRGQETEEHKNITISQDNTDLTFTLNDDLYLGNVNEGTGAYVNVLGSTGQILLGKDATNFINIDGGSRTISGLSNLDWNYNDYQAGKYKDSSLAATESQLHDAFGYLNNKIDSIDISGDDNITVDKPAGTGSGSGGEGGETTGNGPKFEVGLNDDVTLGTTDDKTGNVTNSGSLTIKDTSGNTITINKKDPVTGKGDGHVSGLTNTDWD